MNPNKVKVKGSSACKCCEGTGKAFNAIDAEWAECLYCGGSGLKRGQSVTTQPETDAEATAPRLPMNELAIATKSFEALVDAAWQVLDDMGKDGLSCCGASKAQLRVAFEPFMQAAIKDDPSLADGWAPEYTFEEAAALLKEIG